MKILSFNINGFRSVMRKGFDEWIAMVNPDLICLQETKVDQLTAEKLELAGYHGYWHSAYKKGYSGTAIFTKSSPLKVHYGMNNRAIDLEGRVIGLTFEQFTLWSCYFPSGASAEHRQEFKLEFLKEFDLFLKAQPGKHLVTGDFNLCHTAADIHNPIRLNGVPGFTEEERLWMTNFLANNALIDTYRHLNPEGSGVYSWWSYMARAKERNAGWRIDYQLCSSSLLPHLRRSVYLKEVSFSDHCPQLTEWEGLSTSERC